MKDRQLRWLRRLMLGVGLSSIAALLALPVGARAGDHWLSGVTIKTLADPDMMFSAIQTADEGLASVVQTTATAVFDITISLDSNPQGDDDWTVDSGAADAEQRAFEERIKEFANAVYQSTNGAHQIGRVTIFREGAQRNRVDVIWDEDCPAKKGPRANPSGFGMAGRHIWMCTHWPGASTLMSTPKGSGYTLAHEWGHYAYGLYDEYASDCRDTSGLVSTPLFEWLCHRSAPRSTDTEAIPSIMTNQWNAARGTVPAGYTGSAADFLEFSTQNIHPFRHDSTGTNAQERVFAESAWETLTRDPATDPKFRWLPTRTQYLNLIAPGAPNWIVNDDESPALDALDIRWVGDQVMDLSIDVSGSMSGAPLANARTGANLLIDQVQAGTALGVSSFASTVRRNFAITDIPDPDTGVRAAAKTAVNALSAGGLTAMYDGLIRSLNDTQAFDSNRPAVVYLLSDGGDNASSATEASAISAYQAASVPIIAFAYGSFAPTGTLLNLANSTGGAFFASPTSLPEIQQALLTAEAQFSDTRLLSSTQISAAAGTTVFTLPLDSTLASALINVSYTGSPADLTLSLLGPGGSDTGATFECEGATSCWVILDVDFFAVNGYGDYQVEIVNHAGISKNVTVLASASPWDESYDIAVGFSRGTVVYPADMAIMATITKGTAITGLDVIVRVTDPLGHILDLPLLDDGSGADLVAGDGTYSASIPYSVDGIYSALVTASNVMGGAQTTLEGILVAPTEDGSPVPAFVPTPISENFVRVGAASATVAGVTPDDHADHPAGGACTMIVDDNTDTEGRVDFAGDKDCFTFVPSAPSDPIIVRVTSLTSGMDPLLTIYDHTGALLITQVDMSTSASPDSGVTVTVPPAELDPVGMILVVEHIDARVTTGGYAVSVGAALASDVPLVQDSDGDGVPDEIDACPNSNLAAHVEIGSCDSSVINHLSPDGCTISDRVELCALRAEDDDRFVSCVAHLSNDLVASGIIGGRDRGSLLRCAGQARRP
jgi:calcium-activated chloride channel regulator 3/4